MNNGLYIFLDESGNLDFSANGTQYFVLTSISVIRPFCWSSLLDSLKYDCIESGLEDEHFHCSQDKPSVRSKVFNILTAHLNAIRVDSLIVEKRKTDPALTVEKRFYPKMLGYLLQYVSVGVQWAGIGEILIITDKVPLKNKRNAIKPAIKSTLQNMLPSNLKHRILHHESRSHYGLQIADYCCWAIFQKYENGKKGYYNAISPSLHSEFDIFQNGTKYYY